MKRLFPNDESLWEEESALPKKVAVSNAQLLELANTIETLRRTPQSRLMLEWFLCEMFRILNPYEKKSSDIPSWLQNALREIQEPSHFKKGSTALAELSHRSPEHVSRATKKFLQKTPSQIVNEARIQYAANETLTAAQQSRAVTFYSNPAAAQSVRQSNRSSDERFWKAYRAYEERAEAICR